MINRSDIPLVSLDTMNEVHLEEATMLYRLLELLDSEAAFEKISESLNAFIAYMQAHFMSEERLMQEARYPSYRMHKAEHDRVLNQARSTEMEWRNRKNAQALREYLEDDVVTWLEQHIKAMDTPMADFVTQFDKYKSF